MDPAERTGRTLPDDWHDGVIPDNVSVDPTAYIETSYSFERYRSQAHHGVRIGKAASIYQGTMFDVGPQGVVRIGDYALLNGCRIVCDSSIQIGEFALLSWNVVLMDNYRAPWDVNRRREMLDRIRSGKPLAAVNARPIIIGPNTWLGFDVCVLPGVTIGRGSVVGARSVVADDIPPYSIAVGNPARVIRKIDFTSGDNQGAAVDRR